MDADWSPRAPAGRRVPAEPGRGGGAPRRLARGREEAVALALGAPIAAIKLGDEGSIGIRAADEVVRPCRARRARPVDPTGCGDAFCGGFLVGLAETGDLRDSARARDGRGGPRRP